MLSATGTWDFASRPSLDTQADISVTHGVCNLGRQIVFHTLLCHLVFLPNNQICISSCIF